MAHDILIVDDEEDIRLLIAGVLEDEGYRARGVAHADAALAEIDQRVPALLILDIWLQGSRLDGLELLQALRRSHPNLPIVMISGHGNIETAVEAIKLGAYDYIEKPFKADRMLLVVERALEAARLRRENQELRQRAESDVPLVGQSAAMNAVRAAIERVAPTNSRVLISGGPGSGKEIVARHVHRLSRRADGPFVVLNAASITPERMEQELFGSEPEPDSTGQRAIGTFERAHGGTLFVDEVGDMPLGTQAKILRVLQEQTFVREGGRSRVEVNVRVIAATNRDLVAEMAAGSFRQDLYYRLNVVPIAVPSLRDRREDVPLLAEHFLRRFSDLSGLPRRDVAADAMAALQAYDWPGNVRQLRNVIEQLLIMAPGDAREPIGAGMLPPEISAVTPASMRPDSSAEVMAMPLREARETFERQYLLAQITRFGGNISRTATFIGMERSALHRKLKALGVTDEDRT